MKEVSRGIGFLDEKKQEAEPLIKGVVVSLRSHHENVTKLCETIFFEGITDEVLRDSLRIAALHHDIYKPATISLVQKPSSLHEFFTSFLGHPYMLGFSDFEAVGEDYEKIGYATGMGRLHHVLNVRDVDKFFETIAIVKHYLLKHGIDVSVSSIRRKVLLGVLLLHMCDNISAFVEQYTIKSLLPSITSLEDVYDTSSEERIYPHLPLTIIPEGSTVNIYFFSLERYYRPKRSEETYTYDVYLGVFKVKEAPPREGMVRYKVIDFEVQEKRSFSLNFRFLHKSNIIESFLNREYRERCPT